MATCKRCFSQKLSERRCPRCGGWDNGPDKWPEVTKEQVAKIAEMVEPEFATGDWQTVEKE